MRGQFHQILDVDETSVRDLQNPEVPSHLAHPMHRAAEESNRPVVFDGCVDQLLYPMYMAGKASGQHSPRGVVHDVSDGLAQRALGGHETGILGIGAVGHQQAHALPSQFCEGRKIGRTAVDGCGVELEVSGMNYQSLRGLKRHPGTVGNTVRNRNQLESKPPKRGPLVVGHGPEFGIDTQLFHPTPGEGDGKLSSEDRNVDVTQEVSQRSDVVFVAVSQNYALDVRCPVDQPAPVREHQIDSQHVFFRKHEPAVDERDLAIDLESRAVAPDFPQSS